MYTLDKDFKPLFDLCLAMAIAFVLLILNIAINAPGSIGRFLEPHSRSPATGLIVNLLFVWLAGMLAIAFLRWRRASRARAQLEAVIASISPDAMLVVTPDRRIELCNTSVERLLGYRRDEVIGNTTDMLYFDRRIDKARNEVQEALEKQGFHIGKATAKHKDGGTLPIEIISGDLKGRGGAVLLLHDVTERDKAERTRHELELQVQQRQKLESLGVLAGGIAHDFNNLLMVIHGDAELALRHIPAESEADALVRDILTAAMRAGDLCGQMLAYAGKGRCVIQPLVLSDVVQEMGRLLEVPIAKSTSVVYRLAPSLPPIEGDVVQIHQIIMNLITNAAESIGEQEGRVIISTDAVECDEAFLQSCFASDATPGRFVCLEVSDSGCGMDEETRARIFDPFFTTKFTGRGLGLSAVLGVIRSHGGTLKVRSAPGKGTAFKVFFPVSERTVPRSEESEVPDDWKGHGTILLVDDEEPVRDVTTRLLQSLGFDVLTAGNGREAVRQFRQHADRIRAVILDVTMPRMGGKEAMIQIRRIDPAARVILASGFSFEDVGGSHEDRGGAPSAFIHKPFNLGTLRRHLRQVLADPSREEHPPA